MNINLLLGLIFGTIIVTGLGGGVGYWFYIKTRTKKVTYKARIYELSGELGVLRDKDGLIKSELRLGNLKPFDKDVIEKVDLEYKNTIYKLTKHNRPVPEVKAEHIVHWGPNERVVNVLKDGDNFTLLRQGLHKNKEIVFEAVDYDLSNMILNQYSLKMDRRKKEKDVLQAVTPWVVVGICMMALVMSSYFLANGWIKSSETQKFTAEINGEAQKEISGDLVEVAKLIKSGGLTISDLRNMGIDNLGAQT